MTDEIVTSENTKLIAKWMGKNLIENIDSGLLSVLESCGVFQEYVNYNLITNAKQSHEIIKKLLAINWVLRVNTVNNTWEIKLEAYNKGVKYIKSILEAETFELVIYKAALWEAKK